MKKFTNWLENKALLIKEHSIYCVSIDEYFFIPINKFYLTFCSHFKNLFLSQHERFNQLISIVIIQTELLCR